MIQTKN